MEEVFKLLSEIFKVPGDGAPEVEIKFRIRHPKLDDALHALVENGTLVKYEFPVGSGMWHYKAKKKLTMEKEEEEYSELGELVQIIEILVRETNNTDLLEKLEKFKLKYNY